MRRYASLRGRREFALVLRRGRTASAKHLVVFAFSPALARRAKKSDRDAVPMAKVGIVITKKVGKAVVRNLLRRRCKAILDESAVAARGAWFVVQCRPNAAGLSFTQLRAELLQAVSQSLERPAGTRPRRRET